MKTLAEEWADYAAKVGLDSPAVGAVQRREMCRAFYAGMVVMFAKVNEASADPKSVEQGEAELSAMNGELKQHLRDLRAGRA